MYRATGENMTITFAAHPVIRWKLRAIMADRKMTAKRLSELMGVHRVTVSGWANSDVIPNFGDSNETLDRLCHHLECTPGDLIVYTPEGRQ